MSFSISNSFSIVASDFVLTGGMDRANYALADYLSRQGYNIHLVTHRVDRSLMDRSNVTVHQVLKPLDSYSLGAPLLARKGIDVIRKSSKIPNHVIVNGGNCLGTDINWVHYVHAAYRSENLTSPIAQVKTQLDRQIALRGERKALQQARIAIANSNLTKKHLIDLLEISPSKVKTIYYGTDPDVFYPASADEKARLCAEYGWDLDCPIVVFIGALGDRRKGFDTLFGAWQQLCQNPNWNARLVTIGIGDELALWQQRTAAAGLTERIEFMGFRRDVPSILRAAECLVAPTRYEAYGLGVHEALCCGLPAITTATAGVAERYSSELQDLLLPDANNVEELIRRLSQWQQQHDYYRQQAIALSDSLRRYTWDDMARDLLDTIANH
jgi:glycosyltransferase involved in cell wall biosynthesis